MTGRMNDIATLITQLRVVGQLTRAEAQIARLRVAQASTDAVREELRQNAADADGRFARIAGALRDLGALPDPVTPLFGRVAALVRGALEQAQPLDEAVLGDLMLEHQLRDRAQYAGALAEAIGRPEVRELVEHLVAAHTETIQWLTGVLADLGAGRRAALSASPLQKVAAQVTHAANAPARSALKTVGAGVTQTVQAATEVAGAARDTAAGALDKATAVTGDAASGLAQGVAATAGAVKDTVDEATGKAASGAVQGAATAADAIRGTAMQAVERSAHAVGGAAGTAADAVTSVTEAAAEIATDTATEPAATNMDAFVGTIEAAAEEAAARAAAADEAAAHEAPADKAAADDTPTDDTPTDEAAADNADAGRTDGPPAAPPIAGFADLSAHAAVAALRTLDDPRDVTAMLEFEQEHGNRPAVVAAARLRAAAVDAR